MTDTEILDWLIEHKAIDVGQMLGGDARVINTAGCGCCAEEITDTPPEVFDRVKTLWWRNDMKAL